jgi:hypothetical protein
MGSGRVSKARRARAKLSRSLQQHLLASLARIVTAQDVKKARRNGLANSLPGVESPWKTIQRVPPMAEDQRVNTDVPSSKRPIDATSVTEIVPAQRPRLTPTVERPHLVEGAGEKRQDQAAQVCQHR